MDTSLNAYAEEFETALTKQSQFANFNKDMDHAAIIVCMAFRHANDHIRLLSHKLDPALYGSEWFLDELRGFLGRGGKLEILIETEVTDDHPIMKLELKNNGISVRRVSEEDVDQYSFNFMTVDNNGFRFEADRELPEATVVFNFDDDPRFKKLRESSTAMFDRLWESSGDKVK